jgi:hypothetical protein
MRFRRKRALRWIADAIVALGGTVFNIVIARILGQVGNSNHLPGLLVFLFPSWGIAEGTCSRSMR